MNRPRVLLVDDDPSIRRFVALALEDLDIELIEAASVHEARERLAGGAPFALIVTDLMMPGETGLDLLQHLADHPSHRAGARLAVFSAGLNAAMQQRLSGFDVWRQLSKPISVLELEDCVREAVGVAPAVAGGPGGAANAPPAVALGAEAQEAIQRHFAGDRALFLAYRSSCIAQFEADVRAGDAALAQGDMPALCRLAHSLKSVLLTLGEAPGSAIARALENAAGRTDATACASLWQSLRDHLASQR
jgi:CheY-like chemotaxis protein